MEHHRPGDSSSSRTTPLFRGNNRTKGRKMRKLAGTLIETLALDDIHLDVTAPFIAHPMVHTYSTYWYVHTLRPDTVDDARHAASRPPVDLSPLPSSRQGLRA